MQHTIKFMMLMGIVSLVACGGHKEGECALDHDHEHEDAPVSTAETTNDNEITLHEDAQEMLGVKSDTIYPRDFNSIIVVSGQIADAPNSTSVVSAPTSGMVKFANGISAGKEVNAGTVVATISAAGMTGGNPNESARVELQRAEAEYKRLQPLYAEKLVTAQTYNEAKAAYEAAKTVYSPNAASGAARAVKQGVITSLLAQEGEYVEAGTPIATVSGTRSLTLRADVPERYRNAIPNITSANIELTGSDQVLRLDEMQGKRINGSQLASTGRGYVPVYFEFANDGNVLPGSFVKVFLLGSARNDVIAVPKTALTEQQGQYFVFKRMDEDCFEKIPVKIGPTDGDLVEITSGLHGGEDIVVAGTTAVRLAESSGVVPEGHSHSH